MAKVAAKKKASASAKAKAVTKKTAAKKTATKKVASKASAKVTAKAVAKKTAKVSAKVAAKKTPAAKPVAKKKAVAKKVATKPATAKKAAPNKVVADKPVAKRKVSATSGAATSKKRSARKTAATSSMKDVPTTAANDSIATPAQPIKPPPRGSHYMDKQQLAHFSELLAEWKQQLMEEVDRTVGHMKDDATNFPDPNDRATQEEEFSLELRTRDRERKLIKKINEAQKRIDDDEYGYCETCGIEIGVNRLEARPTAELCIDCKTLEEIRERQTA